MALIIILYPDFCLNHLIKAVFLVDKNGVINAMNLRGERTEEAVKALLTNGPKN